MGAALLDGLVHPRASDEPPWKLLPLVLALAFAARAAVALAGDFVLHPDEIMQYLEPAHRLAFGNGVVYWEYFYSARSWLVPGAVAGVLKLSDAVGLGQPWWYVGGVKLMFCASSLAIPAAMYWFARCCVCAGSRADRPRPRSGWLRYRDAGEYPVSGSSAGHRAAFRAGAVWQRRLAGNTIWPRPSPSSSPSSTPTGPSATPAASSGVHVHSSSSAPSVAFGLPACPSPHDMPIMTSPWRRSPEPGPRSRCRAGASPGTSTTRWGSPGSSHRTNVSSS